MTRRLVERVLEGEMTAHLGYEKHAQEGRDGGNSRNGKTSKRVKTDSAEMGIEVPRDREGTFDPQMVAKGQRRLPGFDEKVIALYRSRHDNTGDPGASEGALPGRGIPDADLNGDGCGNGGRTGVAGPGP